MITRILTKELKSLAAQYRVVTVIGPRQAGKSTICKLAFPEKPLVNLEDPETRALAVYDPKGLLEQHKDGCFIDEIQRVPELLSYIQTIVDRDQKAGQFILSGSHQSSLINSISQSLAGRTAIVKLLALSQEEIGEYNQSRSVNEILLRGSYPEVVAKSLDHSKAYSFYTQTYLEKDVREIQAIKDLSVFQNFMALIAGRSANIMNIRSISNDIGMSENTVRNWFSVLEASFIAFRLKPYYKNLSKRQIKSPKLYFHDTGLLCYLLGIRKAEQLQNHPARGAIFETYVVSEILKNLWNKVRESNLYFFADSVVEIDVVAETSKGLLAIEIKSSATFRDDFLKQIKKAKTKIPLAEESALVYAGENTQIVNGTQLIGVKKLSLLGDMVLI